MYRFSNSVIGCLNLLTLLASVPIIGGGLWMSKSSATCESSLQTPLLVLGFVVLLVSLAGFVGACFNVAWALWLYLLVMLLLIGTLLGLTAFGFAVTAGGGGVQVPGRPYHEYRLDYYTGWLRRRITERQYWKAAMACVVGSKTCAKIALWTPLDYLQRDLSPIQVTLGNSLSSSPSQMSSFCHYDHESNSSERSIVSDPTLTVNMRCSRAAASRRHRAPTAPGGW